MKVHTLKTHPGPFDAVRKRVKTFEIRNDDRKFETGDLLILRRYDPDKVEGKKYDGSALLCAVTYKLEGGEYGIETGYCGLAIEVLQVFDRKKWMSPEAYDKKRGKDKDVVNVSGLEKLTTI